MAERMTTRRMFLGDAIGAAGSIALSSALVRSAAAAQGEKLHVACNAYSWSVFYQRQGRNFDRSLDEGLAEVAASGLDGFEPSFADVAQVERLAPLQKKHGLEMRSFYVNSTLHEADRADESIRQILAVAPIAKEAGARIVVTNPNPLAWGGAQDKNDEQLKVQAAALNRLGAELKKLGLTLAYHNHDMELRQAAREFHHMMLGTDPTNVTLCLDAHWVYRGAGNSQVALFDVVKLYGRRIGELHLRQSQGDVWTEAFGPGDIDYRALAEMLRQASVRPHVVLEQAIETGSPNTMTPLEAFKESTKATRHLFTGIGAA
ncbi:MAG: sugar phosphate isomerase/epimerase [Planctomycetota bacterium]|nr:sugar phosphate isomerase/epimerase [Planctomycetota bacterium]